MLANFNSVPTLAVSDLQRARDFYGGLLGFPVASENPEGTFYSSGSGNFFVYRSSFAGTNKATAMSIQMPADSFDADKDAKIVVVHDVVGSVHVGDRPLTAAVFTAEVAP